MAKKASMGLRSFGRSREGDWEERAVVEFNFDELPLVSACSQNPKGLGFGLGIERTVSWICGLDHIRETNPFPRMIYRITP